MDKTLETLVSYALSAPTLTPNARRTANKILFDSIGCIVLGSDCEPVAIAARRARKTTAEPSATVFGFGFKTSVELAAWTNTMMVRYYDYNDSYPKHPSDMIPGVLAAGEVAQSSGAEVLDAIALAYDIRGALEVGAYGERGTRLFDNLFAGVSTALAVGKLWGLNAEQLAHAASLTLVSNLTLPAVRNGDNSVMVGCATAFGVRAAVFSTLLAMDGFTGPPEPFEGLGGIYEFTGNCNLRLPVLTGGRRVIEQTVLKPLPSAHRTIPALEWLIKNRNWAPLDEIESIEFEVPEGYDSHVASEHKYDPKDRKTADHSLPYMAARALVDGEINLDTCSDEKVLDPSIRPLMRRVRVTGSREMGEIELKASLDPEVGHVMAVRGKLRAKGGREISAHLSEHTGSPGSNPGRDFFDKKFSVVTRGISPQKREQLYAAWWDIENVTDISEPIKTLHGIRQL